MIESSSLDDVLGRAHALMQQQCFGEAIALLADACRRQSDVRCEQQLAQLRHDAYAIEPPRSNVEDADQWRSPTDLFADVNGIPERSEEHTSELQSQ